MELVAPSDSHLASYLDALRKGWSPDNTRACPSADEIQRIEQDPQSFLRSLDDRDASGPPITLPDGTTVTRLPGFHRWMWDGEFCGTIGIRWQPGTADLPPHCLGHVGYAVVAWKRNRGYATAALRQILPEAKAVGLPYIDLTTDRDNLPSQRVITANGGVLVERFDKPQAYGGGPALRFRISLGH